MRLFVILDERGCKMKLFSKTYLRDILMIKVGMLCRLTLDVHSHQGSFSSPTPSWVAPLPREWGHWALGPTARAPHEPDPITIIKNKAYKLKPWTLNTKQPSEWGWISNALIYTKLLDPIFYIVSLRRIRFAASPPLSNYIVCYYE